MMLSPWFPPRYLWAAIEGAGGLDVSRGTPTVTPRLAPDWKWLGVRNLPYGGRHMTWFVMKTPELRMYTDAQFHQSTPYIAYDRDISEDVRVSGDAACAMGLRKGEDMVIFVGNTTEHTVATALSMSSTVSGAYSVKAFNSLRAAWVDNGMVSAEQIRRGMPIQLERKGFVVMELTHEI
jgi:hypothetical protein